MVSLQFRSSKVDEETRLALEEELASWGGGDFLMGVAVTQVLCSVRDPFKLDRKIFEGGIKVTMLLAILAGPTRRE